MNYRRREKVHRGRWLLERERCRLESSLPEKGIGDPVGIDAIVAGVMKGLGLDERHWEACLDEEWEPLVGAVIAKHTRPGRFANGRLTVYVDSSVWLSELDRFSKRPMLKALRERFSSVEIRDLAFQLDPEGTR